MYKIKVLDKETNLIWWEYGFTNFIMKRIYFLFNETDDDFYNKYEIIQIIKIYFTFSTFKKCLTHYVYTETLDDYKIIKMKDKIS